MAEPVPTVGCRATLEQAFMLMQHNSGAAVAVTDAAGKLVGLVTSETLADMMLLMTLPGTRRRRVRLGSRAHLTEN
jgi:CBS-domain-containing membrane protein